MCVFCRRWVPSLPPWYGPAPHPGTSVGALATQYSRESGHISLPCASRAMACAKGLLRAVLNTKNY